ncbi:hypothetical protein HJC23_001692 [Cyclotella cryptica]|uniref:Uncharacterized protein n=1 Tax=Cyclotella cryptica TaxID=29204 RepID=A0ABD3QKV5_9STRA|eukprot:CCRYP_004733-RA/>CCRYP_004733-RA protein AED:0.30 eAED:0.30 QI:0/-1/0/1/-1/1/1/0/655
MRNNNLPPIETSQEDDDDYSNDDDHDDDPLHENYIALLQYRSPHHILNLSPSPTPPSPTDIEQAYVTCRQETWKALRLTETKMQQQQQQGGGTRGNNAFFMSQLNYLELKLRALDQAVNALLPGSSIITTVEEGTNNDGDHDDNNKQHYVAGGGNPKPPSTIERATKPPPPTTKTTSTRRITQSILQPDDELDTIDIYFRPQRPRHTRGTSWSSASASESRHSMDMSSVSWDVSRYTPEEEEEDDDNDGVLQVLGPMKNRGEKESKIVAYTSQGEKGKRQSKDSPRSIVDFPTENGFYGVRDLNKPDYNGAIGGTHKRSNNNNKSSNNQWQRHKPPKPASHILTSTTTTTAQCTIEAARKGVLRALSEDDSECLPLEEEYNHNHSNKAATTHHNKNNTPLSVSLLVKRTTPHQEGQLPREKIVSWGKTIHTTHDDDDVSDADHHRRNNDDDSLVKSVESSSRKSETSSKQDFSKQSVMTSSYYSSSVMVSHDNSTYQEEGGDDDDEDEYRTLENLVPSSHQYRPTNNRNDTDDYYDTLLQSSMALADDLCGNLLGVCWESGTTAAASSSGFVGKASRDNKVNDSIQTWEHNSTYDNESSFSYLVGNEDDRTEEDGGGEESTAFNSLSSFGSSLPAEVSTPESYLVTRYRERKMLV